MSNKKRIAKKIKLIDFKNKKNQTAGVKLIKMTLDKIQESFSRSELFLNYFSRKLSCYLPPNVRCHSVYVEGYSIEENFDSEFTDFVFEMRKLTPLDEMSCRNLCRKIPMNLRIDFKNLVIVGFEAYEAFHLLKETYKF